ncbi:alpha/beta hydrolase [Asanoa sp. NPDC050611]|uniref:alpha/beta fold hydrolase n=1 Tax=Asanoa sp. NPDC050611 TaxID=3157098 RepID=UPI0033D320EB
MRNLIVLAPVAWGIGAGLWTPRGPLTANEALWSVALSAAVGVAAGRVSRSRWAMLFAPAAFVVALELTRIPVGGPSVDVPQLSTFGLIALVTGRGLHGILAVLPMIVGAAYGAALTRDRRAGRRIPRYLRRAGVATLAAAVGLVAFGVAVPARTPPIAGGVAELVTVDAGGYDLRLLVRGRDAAKPVLLFVPGAPGAMEMGATRRHLGALEDHFVVATLDRRGYPALDSGPPISLDTGVADTITVTNFLRTRFGQDRIYLLAHSGGSLLGALAAARHPELYKAYVGTGQAVDLPETDGIFYADILSWARATRNDELERRLVDLGPPPYQDFYSYEPIVANTAAVYAQGDPASVDDIMVEEYPLLDQLHTVNALLDTWHAQYPDMQRVDLRRDVPRLAVPAYFVQGADETRGISEPFAQWYAQLAAPAKRLFVLDAAGHRAMFEQPAGFVDAMLAILAGTT